MPKSKCLNCGADTNTYVATYCSSNCHREYKWLKAKELITQTGLFPTAANGRVPKRYLREMYGNTCSICKGTEWLGKPMPLILDHIDGNSDNWSVANMRMICGNCDMQLPTYKSRNMGNGRASRRQRYAEGKSY
jgi:hypothetical protein